MKIALLGPANVGKSSIYNAVAGYKSVSSNFAGTTIQYEKSIVRLNGLTAELIDFPGCYSLSAEEDIAVQICEYLITESVDVIVSIVDASRLERTLPLTLELVELGRPVVVALNMIDEVHAKGTELDTHALSASLGVPVVETIASRNVGVRELFRSVKEVFQEEKITRTALPTYSREIEESLIEIEQELAGIDMKYPVQPRFLATKLLDGNRALVSQVTGVQLNGVSEKVNAIRNRLLTEGKRADTFMISERNAIASALDASITQQQRNLPDWRERLDNVLLHPR